MQLSYDQTISKFDRFCAVEIEGYTCYYQGVFFIRGYRAGEESVIAMMKDYQEEKGFAFSRFCGAFLMIVHDRIKDKYICFSDNSSLRSFYLGNTVISDSFLELIESEKDISLNAENVSQFISLGYVAFEKTVVNEIIISNRESYYTIKNGVLTKLKKDIGRIYDNVHFDSVEAFFKDVSYALENEYISFDITGGFDSRLVLCEMNKWLPQAEVAISGPENSPDIIVGKKVAFALGKQIDYFSPNILEISDEIILELLQYAQCMESFVEFFREWKFALYRRAKGVNVRITGDGGVLHKDWFWIQDFPFYNKRIRNKRKFLSKYYETRAQIINSRTDFFAEDINLHLRSQKQKFIDNCIPYCRHTNTETYDMLSYYISATHHYCRYNLQAPYVQNYAPLMEYEYVKYAYHLPRKERFFNNYMRKCIDKCNPSVAKIRTIYGTRSTGSLISRIMDIPFYAFDSLKRVKVLLKRIINNTNTDFGVEQWAPEEFIRNSTLLDDAYKYCMQIGLLKEDVKKETLDMNAIQVILNIYNLKLRRKKDIVFK